MFPSTPATRSDLVIAGHTPDALDAALRRGTLRAPFRGVYCAGTAAGVDVTRAAALLTQAPGACLSHRTAAVIHGLRWLPDSWRAPDVPVDVTANVDCTRRPRPGVRLFRSRVGGADVDVVQSLPVTNAGRTVIDLIRARDVDRLLGLQLLDGGLRFGAFTLGELHDALDRLAGSRGFRRAHDLVTLAREGVDSPQETWLRLVLVDGGIRPEEIEIGIKVRDSVGLVLARSDLGNGRHLMWWEYDGRESHDEIAAGKGRIDVFGADRTGDRVLSARGWLVSRFTSADRPRPYRVVADWRRQVRDAPARIAALRHGCSPEADAAKAALARLRTSP